MCCKYRTYVEQARPTYHAACKTQACKAEYRPSVRSNSQIKVVGLFVIFNENGLKKARSYVLTIFRCFQTKLFLKAEVLEARRDSERREAAEKAFASFDTNDDGEKPGGCPAQTSTRGYICIYCDLLSLLVILYPKGGDAGSMSPGVGKSLRTLQRDRDDLTRSTPLAIDPTTARKSRTRLGKN